MKSKFSSIKFKLVSAYLLSAFLSGICIITILSLLLAASYKRYNELTLWINNHIIPFLLVSGFVFVGIMTNFFLFLIRKEIKYLDEITRAINCISEGDLDTSIPLRTLDEFGILASSINTMAFKLKTLIEEERDWERSKDELINSVSHDLRTPLTSILGYLQLISEGKYPNEVILQQYVSITHDKCLALKSLIDDLFEYSKLNTRELKIDKKVIDLGQLLEQVLQGFIPLLDKTDMEYRLVFEDRKFPILADPGLIARLFDNLINNAITYGREGKHLDIELSTKGSNAIVRVSNYGEVIPQEDLFHIFEKFYRVEKSRTRNSGGTGLGLAIVKSIVEIHGGEIRVTSYNNKTTFEVSFKFQ